MNPRGKLGPWWQAWFGEEFRECLADLQAKMQDIEKGLMRYSDAQEAKLARMGLTPYKAIFKEESEEMEKWFATPEAQRYFSWLIGEVTEASS